MANSVNVRANGAGKSKKSVVPALMNRQLGVPFSPRNRSTRTVNITQQIMRSRAASVESGKHVKATRVELMQPKNNGTDGKPVWIQIGVSGKTEMIGVTDTRIWIRMKHGARGNTISKEEFYSVEPSASHGLKRVKSLHSSVTGKVNKAFVIGGRSLTSEKTTTHFLTLMEPGILRAFDLVKNQVTDELQLPLSISRGVTAFKDMDVFDNSRKIFIMGTGMKLTKVIIVMNYPPWQEMGIIHVEIPAKISMSEGVCFLLQGKFLQITTWSYLMQKVKVDGSEVRNQALAEGLPVIKFEGKLTEFPTILKKVRLYNEYFGLLTMNSVPLYYASSNTGLDFFTFHENSPPVCEFQNSLDSEDTFDLFPFPDGSSKTLICTRISDQAQLVEFKSEWKDEQNGRMVEVETLTKLNYWDKPPQQNASTTISNDSIRRPKRTCVNNNTFAQLSKISTLGLAYCVEMDLIAVLTADEEVFHVTIYEPLKLDVVKVLPPVLQWPKVKGSDTVNKKRESIENVEFNFEPEFIFVGFHYSSSCKPQREVLFARLLSEPHC